MGSSYHSVHRNEHQSGSTTTRAFTRTHRRPGASRARDPLNRDTGKQRSTQPRISREGPSTGRGGSGAVNENIATRNRWYGKIPWYERAGTGSSVSAVGRRPPAPDRTNETPRKAPVDVISRPSTVYKQTRSDSQFSYSGLQEGIDRETRVRREKQMRVAIDAIVAGKGVRGATGLLPAPLIEEAGTRGNSVRRDDARQGGGHHRQTKKLDVNIDLHFGHVHGPHCGHYHYRGRWHDYPSHHVHGSRCGRNFVNGAWISFGIGHAHGPGCGHFRNGGVWLSHAGYHHRHAPGCGHYFYDGLWHNHSWGHVHFHGCGHFHFRGAWHDFPETHVHSATCGHLYDGVRWYVSGHSHHVHRNGCGHYFYRDRWHIYPRRSYIRNRMSNFYFFIDLGHYERRNVPHYVYDRQSRYEAEPVNIFEADDHLSKAYAAFENGRYYRALVEFNAAIDEAPEDGLLYLARGHVHIAVGDYRSAYDDLVHGMELIPDWGKVEFNMGEIYGDPDVFGEHFERLKKWVTEHPRDYQAHFVLGYVHYFLQEYETAKAELVYTLAWEPKHAQANRLMEDILEREAEQEVRGGE